MRRIPQLAYGNARVRARKSRLLSSAIVAALVSAERPELTVEGWRDVESDADARSLFATIFGNLIDDYDAAIRAYPRCADVLRAFARLHELENVKLAWRAALGRMEPARWESLWRPMGRLEAVSAGPCTSATSIEQLAAALSRTPFEAIAAAVLRAHGSDLAAAEMAFDRWGSTVLVQSANACPAREKHARDLVRRFVCERDVTVLERAIGPLGLSPQAAIRMTSGLASAFSAAAVRQLGEWTGEGGPSLAMPRLLSTAVQPVRTFTELRRALRAARRAACRRVFLGHPFSLAPGIAFVLLREDEVGALISIGELRAAHASTTDAVRVLQLDG